MKYRVITPSGSSRIFDDSAKAKKFARQCEDSQIQELWSDQWKFIRYYVRNGKCVKI